MGGVIVFILKMREQRLRKVNWLTQDREQVYDSGPGDKLGLMDPKACMFLKHGY